MGIYGTLGGGFQSGTDWGFLIGDTKSESNAKSISDLEGPFNCVGAQGSAFVGVDGEVYWGDSPDGPVTGINVTGGFGVGCGVYGQKTITGIIRF